MIVVVGVFLMLAFNMYPQNQYLSQRNFLIGMAVLVFSYHLYQMVQRRNVEGIDETVVGGICPPPTQVQVVSVEQGLSDVELTGANVHHIRVFDSDPGYSHPSLNIKSGDVVVWTNVGELEHTVTSAKRAEWQTTHKMELSCEFNSGDMKPGQTYAVKFLEKGWFPYFCLHHRGWMQGEINVQ